MQALINFIARFVTLFDNAVKALDYAHVRIHAGDSYVTSRIANIANGGHLDIRFLTGARECHTTIDVSATGKCNFLLYQAPTIAGGTAQPVVNMRTTSTKTSTVTATHTPTVTAVGADILVSKLVPGTTGGNAVGGNSGSRNEIILKPNTEYLFRLTNLSGQANDLNTIITHYEQ
jgi:hypothetical protein